MDDREAKRSLVEKDILQLQHYNSLNVIRDDVMEPDPTGGSASGTHTKSPGGEKGVLSELERRPSSPHDCHLYEDEHSKQVNKRVRMRLIVVTVLCAMFMTAEVIGGLLANSLAIMTDAAHLLSDCATFFISLFVMHIAVRPASKIMSFGWHRAEIIGALISIQMIWLVAGVLVYEAVKRVTHQDYEINAVIMLGTSAAGIVINLVMCAVLYVSENGNGRHGHSHWPFGGGDKHSKDEADSELGSHVHSHSHAHPHAHGSASATTTTASTGSSSEGGSINVRAACLHVFGDLLQGVGVFIAALVIYFKPEWKVADPICTFVFSVLVLLTTIAIMRDIVLVLMEGTPRGLDFGKVKGKLTAIAGVRQVHDLRVWSLCLDKAVLSVHLAIDQSRDGGEVLQEAVSAMRSEFGLYDVTVQIEPYDDESMATCEKCEHPKVD